MLFAYARFIREKYTYVIIGALVAGVTVGLFSSSSGRFIQHFSVPLVFVMIAAMGFTITLKSLIIAAKDWKSFSLGLGLNFLYAPFVCWLLARLFLPHHPDLAAGMILVGAVPCAGMALVWAGLLKGDVPLATVINAATMLVAPLLIPLLIWLFAGSFIRVDTQGMFKSALINVLLPILAGIGLRELLQKRMTVMAYLPVMPALSATAAALLMFMAINTVTPLVLNDIELLGPLLAATAPVFPILFVTAYLIGIRLLPRGKNIAVTYSSGMKNLPIALGLAVVSFNELTMLPIAVSFGFQMLTAVLFLRIFSNTAPVVTTTNGKTVLKPSPVSYKKD